MGTGKDLAQLKNFTSDMIGRFAREAIHATQESSNSAAPRFGLQICVPDEVRAEIAVLKGIVAAFVMSSGRRQPTYQRQRDLLEQLLDALWQSPSHLEPEFAADYASALNEGAARRVIVDQVASLTDQSAISWFERLCQVPLV